MEHVCGGRDSRNKMLHLILATVAIRIHIKCPRIKVIHAPFPMICRSTRLDSRVWSPDNLSGKFNNPFYFRKLSICQFNLRITGHWPLFSPISAMVVHLNGNKILKYPWDFLIHHITTLIWLRGHDQTDELLAINFLIHLGGLGTFLNCWKFHWLGKPWLDFLRRMRTDRINSPSRFQQIILTVCVSELPRNLRARQSIP